jgi:hypothetical protein
MPAFGKLGGQKREVRVEGHPARLHQASAVAMRRADAETNWHDRCFRGDWIWNERQAQRMPMLYSPTIGAAVAARHWFLWVRCPACRTINSIDLRALDRHHDAAISSLIPSLSCRSCRQNAPFAELVRLARTSIADEMREEHRRRVLGE